MLSRSQHHFEGWLQYLVHLLRLVALDQLAQVPGYWEEQEDRNEAEDRTVKERSALSQYSPLKGTYLYPRIPYTNAMLATTKIGTLITNAFQVSS